MKPLNDQLQDIVITRQHTVERYKTYLENKAQRIYQKGMKELRSKLLSYSNNKNDNIKTRKIEKEIKDVLDEIQDGIDGEFEDTLNKELSKFSEDEKDFYANTMEELFSNIKVQIPIIVPKKGTLYSDAKAKSIYLDNGTVTNYNELIDNQKRRGKGIIAGVLSRSYDLDIPIVDVADEAFSTDGGNYKSVVRNAMLVSYLLASHVGAVARDGFFENNEHFVDGYKWISVLDSHTTDICWSRSEKIWYFSDREASTLDGPVEPPAHYSCRSTTSPITKKAEDIQDLSEVVIVAGGLTQILNGKPANTQTYYAWLKEQSDETQEEVLGPTRYSMWKSGEITIEKFYASDERFLTLKELQDLGYKIPKEYVQYIK